MPSPGFEKRVEQDEKDAGHFAADIAKLIKTSGIPPEHWKAVARVAEEALAWGLSKGGNIIAEEWGIPRRNDAERN